ncbi:hypothetical protein [Clostridium thermarum]|nr:hypothetical protein [Clostridium thermarum]
MNGQVVTATVFTSNNCGATATPSNVIATLTFDAANPTCFATGTGSVSVSPGDLVSVQVSTTNMLNSGIAVTIFMVCS